MCQMNFWTKDINDNNSDNQPKEQQQQHEQQQHQRKVFTSFPCAGDTGPSPASSTALSIASAARIVAVPGDTPAFTAAFTAE